MSPVPKSKRRANYPRRQRRKGFTSVRYRGGLQTKINIENGGLVFPHALQVQLPYSEVYSSGTINTGMDDRIWNLNSIFDPDRSGSGHQPMGHDQYAPLYHRYRVVGCHATVEWYNIYATGFTIGIDASNDANGITNITEFSETPGAVTKVIMPTAGSAKLSRRIDIPHLLGITKAQYMADDAYQAIVGTSSNTVAVLHVVTHAPTTGSFSYSYKIRLIYDVIYSDARQLAQS